MDTATLDTVKRVAAWAALISLVWPTQYLLVVPCVYLWRWTVALLAGALKLGVLGLILLCVPIIGWVLLAYLLFFRKGEPAPKRPSVLTPWGLTWVRVP